MGDKELLFGTKEWAPNNFNFMNGCSNDCTYCYAKDMAIRFKRKTSETWKNEIPVDMKGRSYGRREGAIMIPSSHDITPGNIDIALDVFKKLLASGNELLVVTKPHYDCTKKIVDAFLGNKSQIRFRFTIGSADDSVLKLWESGAPCFLERLKSLQYAFAKGYSTSISCEPLLDSHFDVLYSAVHPFVTDAIWVGKMNMAKKRVRDNTHGTFSEEKIESLVEGQSDEKIIALYLKYKDDHKIMWKESIKKIVIAHGLTNF
jgi:DNA repair photolyase